MDSVSEEVVSQFTAVTGADAETARRLLGESNGDVEAALALHFDVGGGDDDPMGAPPAPAAPTQPGPPRLPANEEEADVVGYILDHARQDEAPADDAPSPWALGGRALGSAPSDDDGGAAAAAASSPR